MKASYNNVEQLDSDPVEGLSIDPLECTEDGEVMTQAPTTDLVKLLL